MGADIPTAGIALEPRTILIAALVGVGVTLVSALAPALRATRVPPVAALQEGAALPPTRFTRFTTAIALAVAALGGGSLAYGIFSDGATSNRLLSMGLGALLLFVAIAMLAKFIVRPAAASSAGRWRGSLPPAAVWPATTPAATRAARPPRPRRS